MGLSFDLFDTLYRVVGHDGESKSAGNWGGAMWPSKLVHPIRLNNRIEWPFSDAPESWCQVDGKRFQSPHQSLSQEFRAHGQSLSSEFDLLGLIVAVGALGGALEAWSRPLQTGPKREVRFKGKRVQWVPCYVWGKGKNFIRIQKFSYFFIFIPVDFYGIFGSNSVFGQVL